MVENKEELIQKCIESLDNLIKLEEEKIVKLKERRRGILQKFKIKEKETNERK